MNRAKLLVFFFATVITVAMLTATELWLPRGEPLPISISIGVAGAIYWFTGAAVYLNSSRHTTLSCLVLNVTALALLCALLLSLRNGWQWASTVSMFAAVALPPLLVRSHHVFQSVAARRSIPERAVDGVSVALGLMVAVFTVTGTEPLVEVEIVATVVALELGAAVWLLRSLWIAERSPQTRSQIALVLAGSISQSVIFFVLFATSSFTSLDWLWIASSVILPLTVSVSILRRHFMDIELHRSFVYLLLTAALTLVYVAILLALAYWVFAPGRSRGVTAVASVLFIGLLSIGFLPVVRLTHRLADYVVYRDNYDFRGVLSQMAATIPSFANATELGDYVCTNLTAALNLRWCAVTSALVSPAAVVNSLGPVPAYEDMEIHETAFQNVRKVPMVVNGSHVGDIFVATERPHTRLRPVDEDLLLTVAYQTAVMLENYQLVDSLNQRIRNLQVAQTSRRILHRRLAESEEATRAALSRNLHDGALQSMLHLVRVSESDTEATPPSVLLEDISSLGRDIAIELREICTDLRPHILDNLDLPAAIDSLIKRYRMQFEIDLTLAVVESEPGLSRLVDKNVEVTVFRVINEALYNIFRHASASTVAITIEYRIDALAFTVRDDGVGVSIEEQDLVPLSDQSHLGVIGMFERVTDLDGAFRISKCGESGTEVAASIPLHGGSAIEMELQAGTR